MKLVDGEIALRPFTEDDLPAITAVCRDREIPRWTSIPAPYARAGATPGHHPRLTLTAKTAPMARELCRLGAEPK
ncbi:MAG: hypothetical protein ACRDNR_01505 [Gaiellaceae bacterium]